MTERIDECDEACQGRAVIAGAGAAGLTCAVYLARAGWKVDVYADEERSVSSLSMAPLIQNFPGVPEGIAGADLLCRMQEQAESAGAVIHPEGVEKVMADDNAALLTSGLVVYYDEFVQATGSRHREFACPGSELVPVHYCAVCDGSLYGRNDEVIVVGGGDSAFGDALYLAGIAGKVTVLVRSGRLRVTNTAVRDAFLATGRGEVMMNSRITGIRKADRGFEAVVNGGERVVRADGLFACIGCDPNTLPTEGENMTHFWQCGDCVSGARRQAVIAAASGADTALSMLSMLNAWNDRGVQK